jgi:hypothetical protein
MSNNVPEKSQDQTPHVGDPEYLKNPDQWRTANDSPTPDQERFKELLEEQTGEVLPAPETKAEASKQIDELRQKAGIDND